MHVGKVMARLGPKTQCWNGVGGGKPDITPQDIAGGLAFVPAGLGRELIQYIWSQDSSAAGRKRVVELMTGQLQAEWRRREEAMLMSMQWVCSPEVPRGRATKAYAEAQADRWPAWVKLVHEIPMRSEVYENILKAVLLELAASPSWLEGQDGARISDRGRAELIGRSQPTYREKWAPVYEWLLSRCQEEMQAAYRALRKAIS